MKAGLCWITPNAQDLIVYIARVSNPKSQEEGKAPERLIEYLIRHRHWSPFEMASACFSVDAPRDISRQIIRHRSQRIEEVDEPFHVQEFSQRYADPTQLGFVLREARLQDHKNRQASIDVEDRILQEEWKEWQRMVLEAATQAYRWAIDKGVAKECARVVLPEGLTPSRAFLQANIRDWIHYCAVRCAPGVQKEHRLIADMIWADLVKHMPAIAIAREMLWSEMQKKPKARDKPPPSTASGGSGGRTDWGSGGGSGEKENQ
jgi:thymidylate synthase (FAD)